MVFKTYFTVGYTDYGEAVVQKYSTTMKGQICYCAYGHKPMVPAPLPILLTIHLKQHVFATLEKALIKRNLI